MRIGVNGAFHGRPATGTGQYLSALLPELARGAPEDEFVLVVPWREEIRVLEDISPRVFLYPEPPALDRLSEDLGKVWFEQIGFRRACARERVGVAHVPYFASPYWPPAPTVVTIHDLIPLILPLYRGSRQVRMYTDLVAASARRASAVIADSECSKRDIVQRLGIPAASVHVVYLAADARYHPIEDAQQLAAVRERYALPEHFVLYLGGYDQRKNVGAIVEAFSFLPDLYQAGYRLALAGAAPDKDSPRFPSPEKKAREVALPDDAIRYIGRVAESDKPALYAAADAFLFPSLYEGFGLPVLEAMACGTPVIASDASSLPEIVGDAGILIEPTHSLVWADAIRRVVTEPARRQELRARGLAQASKFSWARAALETLAVYRSIA